MRRLIISLSLVLILVFTSVLPGINILGAEPQTSQSNSSTSGSQADQVVLKGGYLAKVMDYTEEGSPIYQVDFGAPTYCDDLITPIDTKWHEQKDGSFKAGANKFTSEVADEKVRIAKDKEYIEWSPVISLFEADNGTDLTLKAQNAEAEILDADPMNENYNRNTLVWHYDNGIDRYLRLIEAQCQEYYVINQPLESDLVIDPQVKKTDNFTYAGRAAAYDDLDTRIRLTEDDTGKIVLKASSVIQTQLSDNKEIKHAQRQAISQDRDPEVVYPVTIDPDVSFNTSASDGTLCKTGTSYSTVRNGSSSQYLDTDYIDNYVGQIKDGSYYQIDRIGLFFDTSGLETDFLINSATLRLIGNVDFSDTNFYIQIQDGQLIPNDYLVASDYNRTNYSGDGGTFNTSGFHTGAGNPNLITLSADGLSWINKGGATKLMIRSNRDINDGNTPSQEEEVGIYANERGGNYIPRLTVSYTLPSPPAAPTNVTASGGTYNDKIEISWTASDGATGYNIFRNTIDSSGSADQINTNPVYSSPYNDSSCAVGPTYYYWIKAYNSGGESDFSNRDYGTLLFRKKLGIGISSDFPGDNFTDAQNFANTLTYYAGWDQDFVTNYPDRTMWQEEGSPAYGNDNNWADFCELSYLGAHGCDDNGSWTVTQIAFPTGGWIDNTSNTVQLGYASPDGHGYSIWAFISSCLLLKDSSYPYWKNVLHGAHMLLGYKSKAYGSSPQITNLAKRLTGSGEYPKYSVKDAYFYTFVDSGVHRDNWLRIVGENDNVIDNDWIDYFYLNIPVDNVKVYRDYYYGMP